LSEVNCKNMVWSERTVLIMSTCHVLCGGI
jgi:hypothetical protein